MNLNTKSISFHLSYAFAYFLSAVVIKLVGYWHSDILLVICIGLTHFFLYEKSYQLREATTLAVFLIFDKDLVDISNVILLAGVACIREQYHTDAVLKESVTFACGLIFLLAGWFNVARILIINSLLLFYFFTIGSAIVILYIQLLCALFKQSWRTFRGVTNVTDADTK